ncbi:TPA: site-specific DNA-methyltransferase [Photobacterium damselae]
MIKHYKHEIRKVADLIPYAMNSRTHTEEQINQVASSIKEFGFTNPILIEPDNGIIAGHGRVLAAKKINMIEVPCIIVEGLTEAQKKAYVIADNQLALNAGWDEDMLKTEIESLNELDFDNSLLGFNDDFLNDLLFDEEKDGLTPDDLVPDEPLVAVSKIGDVWLLGPHRLMCGSSTDKSDVEILLNGQHPNTMITDPPYGVDYDASWRAEAKKTAKTDREKVGTLKNDNNADWTDAYKYFPGSVAYVWHAASNADVFMKSLRDAGFDIKQQIIWNKNNYPISRSDYHWKHEPCWYAVRDSKNRNWKGGRTQSTVWDIKSIVFEKDKTKHPTQKPVAIYIKVIDHHTSPGEYIYEPFSGSGTAIIACEKTNRRAIAMELDPIFIDVAIERWQKFTGSEAVLESTGETYEKTAEVRLTE